MTKVNFGCGKNRLAGWINHDIEVDIRQRLPYEDSTVNYIFAEHVVEHVTIHEAFDFFEECRRILKPEGVMRIAVPSVENVFFRADPEYCAWLRSMGYADGSRKDAIKSIIFNHGHQTMWSAGLLAAVMATVGFDTREVPVLESPDPELKGVEGHGKAIGDSFNKIETCVVEGRRTTFKPVLRPMYPSLAPLEWFDPVTQLLAGRRIMYVTIPGNAGDRIIQAAERLFFQRIGTRVVATWEESELCVFAGGGSLGTLYPGAYKSRQTIITEASRRGIRSVILPQSFTSGSEQVPQGTVVFAREHRTHANCPGSILVPDMALSYPVDPNPVPIRQEEGVFLRLDEERTVSQRQSICDPVKVCITWQEYMMLAAQYGHVITNRLHFAIGALLSQRRATLLPNGYYKNRAMYESWLSKLGCEWAD